MVIFFLASKMPLEFYHTIRTLDYFPILHKSATIRSDIVLSFSLIKQPIGAVAIIPEIATVWKYGLHAEELDTLEMLVVDEAAQLKEYETNLPLPLSSICHAVLIGRLIGEENYCPAGGKVHINLILRSMACCDIFVLLLHGHRGNIDIENYSHFQVVVQYACLIGGECFQVTKMEDSVLDTNRWDGVFSLAIKEEIPLEVYLMFFQKVSSKIYNHHHELVYVVVKFLIFVSSYELELHKRIGVVQHADGHLFFMHWIQNSIALEHIWDADPYICSGYKPILNMVVDLYICHLPLQVLELIGVFSHNLSNTLNNTVFIAAGQNGVLLCRKKSRHCHVCHVAELGIKQWTTRSTHQEMGSRWIWLFFFCTTRFLCIKKAQFKQWDPGRCSIIHWNMMS